MSSNTDELWEKLTLASGVYNVGDEYPQHEFDFYIKDISEKNDYCSNTGIARQIDNSLQQCPERNRIVYFYYTYIEW